MENNINITPEKSLIDYKEIFEKYIVGDDISRISLFVGVSKRTVYNYISGNIPKTKYGEIISNEILKEALIIINEKKTELGSI